MAPVVGGRGVRSTACVCLGVPNIPTATKFPRGTGKGLGSDRRARVARSAQADTGWYYPAATRRRACGRAGVRAGVRAGGGMEAEEQSGYRRGRELGGGSPRRSVGPEPTTAGVGRFQPAPAACRRNERQGGRAGEWLERLGAGGRRWEVGDRGKLGVALIQFGRLRRHSPVACPARQPVAEPVHRRSSPACSGARARDVASDAFC